MSTRQSKRTGSLTVITGSMFSGKTEELIRLCRRATHARRKVQVFKSAVDTRSETALIRTHDGVVFTAVPAVDAQDLLRRVREDTDVVGVEEIQFFDDGMVQVCQELADRGVDVICAGLDQDFRGLPFGMMPRLFALAEDVVKLHAICKRCGGEASRTQRLIDGKPAAWDDPTVLIGASESYEARCRKCHEVRGVPGRRREPVKPRRRAPLPASTEPRLFDL